jgi:flagellar biosynthetic protein FliR
MGADLRGLGALSAASLETFLLVFVRVAALASVAPVLGHRAIPTPHRIALGLLVALLVAPALGPGAVASATAGGLAVAIAGELFIGLGIGFVAFLVVAAAQNAGEAIGFAGGLSLAALYDPTLGQQTNALARFLEVCTTLLFLAVNGHHLLLRSVVASFAWIGPGQSLAGPGSAGGVVALGGKLFRSGVELAAPALGLLLVVNVGLALLARVAPQMNVFAVGAPLMVAAALFGLAESLPWTVAAASRLIGEIPGDIRDVLVGVGRGF